MIPIYPSGLSDSHTEFLFLQLRDRIEDLEEQNLFQGELIKLLIKDLKALKTTTTVQEEEIHRIKDNNNKIAQKQKNVRVTLAKNIRLSIRSSKYFHSRIQDLEEQIDSLTKGMQNLNIN